MNRSFHRQPCRRWLVLGLAVFSFLASAWRTPAVALRSSAVPPPAQVAIHNPPARATPLLWAAAPLQLREQERSGQSGSEPSPSGSSSLLHQAQQLNHQAIQQFDQGKAEAAIATWQAAQAHYEAAQDTLGSLGTQINQAQALQTLGFYRRARSQMESIQAQIEAQPASEIAALAYQSLGGILQATGYLKDSETMLRRSLAIAQHQSLDPSTILIALGNAQRGLQQFKTAEEQYRQAATVASDPLVGIEAQLNLLSLWIGQDRGTGPDLVNRSADQPAKPLADPSTVRLLVREIEAQLQPIAPSRRKVYAEVNLAASLLQSHQQSRPGLMPAPRIAELLAQAAQEAQAVEDQRAESYAIGELGSLYEQNRQWRDARRLTQQALDLAHDEPDIAYRWQWQLGRLWVEARRSPLPAAQRRNAIAAYQDAIATLRSIRGDLVATTPEIQFSFRESIEPVYREMVSLLIQPQSDAETLRQARDVIEELQLAELENYFRSACFDVSRRSIDDVDPKAAVIYPILLPDRLEVLLSIPGQPMTHHTVSQTQNRIETTLDRWLQTLSPIYSEKEQRQQAQQVYDWLVAPIQPKLAQQGIETLVFVPDGAFRNLPMAALYDGQQYLVENYQIALTPGLQLLEPKALSPSQLQTLSVGLTQARQGFDALPGVRQEIEQIQASVPTQVLLDEAFTKSNLQAQLQSSQYPIVHLATHGQFSSDPEQTFLLTWDDTIRVRDIRALLQSRNQGQNSPIELLVLSACQTAAGDRQAALGLAGMAVQSGARSTLATLWSVNDRSTALLMTELYEQLSSGSQTGSQQISRGRSLRQAQLALIHSKEHSHPFYWSPFVLVGNWI